MVLSPERAIDCQRISGQIAIEILVGTKFRRSRRL
jgi:hypothetical protein